MCTMKARTLADFEFWSSIEKIDSNRSRAKLLPVEGK